MPIGLGWPQNVSQASLTMFSTSYTTIAMFAVLNSRQYHYISDAEILEWGGVRQFCCNLEYRSITNNHSFKDFQPPTISKVPYFPQNYPGLAGFSYYLGNQVYNYSYTIPVFCHHLTENSDTGRDLQAQPIGLPKIQNSTTAE